MVESKGKPYISHFLLALVDHMVLILRPLSDPEKFTAQKHKFSIKDFFSKCDQIRSFLELHQEIVFNLDKFSDFLSTLVDRDEKRFLFHLKSSFYSQGIKLLT